MREKFGRKLREKEKFGFDFGVDFEVESYLRYRGSQFVAGFEWIVLARHQYPLAAQDRHQRRVPGQRDVPHGPADVRGLLGQRDLRTVQISNPPMHSVSNGAMRRWIGRRKDRRPTEHEKLEVPFQLARLDRVRHLESSGDVALGRICRVLIKLEIFNRNRERRRRRVVDEPLHQHVAREKFLFEDNSELPIGRPIFGRLENEHIDSPPTAPTARQAPEPD